MQSDLVVVGAGPAGIATAIAARLKGLQVTVLDFRKPPIDKPCGEGLLPEAVSALRKLGVAIDASAAFRFEAIRFCNAESSATAPIVGGQAFGLRRTVLHELLVERATEVGVRFLWGARVDEFASNYLFAGGQRISLRWLVGADGQNSVVRKWGRLEPRQRFHSRFGFRRHYRIEPWCRCVEVHWGARCQMFLTPTGAEEVCVALLSSDSRMRVERALEQFPEVARRLRGARAVTNEAGAVSVLGRVRAVVRENIALVGDASCPIDGIAGQGLGLAFQQALALGDALAHEDLERYAEAHRRIAAVPVRMTRLLLLMSANAWLCRKALRLFGDNPAAFGKMMATHTHAASGAELKARDVAGLGWRVLWA